MFFKKLVEFFNQGGKGLPIAFLDKDCNKLAGALAHLGKKQKTSTSSEKSSKKSKDPAKDAKKAEKEAKKAAKKRPKKKRV